MSFFNKLGETLTNTSKDLAQKAKVMSEVSSLNGQIQVKEEENTRFVYSNRKKITMKKISQAMIVIIMMKFKKSRLV